MTVNKKQGSESAPPVRLKPSVFPGKFPNSQNAKKGRFTVRSLTFFAFYGALIFVLKMAMAPLPNIEPVSLLIILAANVFGWQAFISVWIYVFLEILVWGAGFWSLSYLYVWPLLFLVAWLLRKLPDFAEILLSGRFGLFFGFFCSWIYLPSGFNAAWAWWLSGIPFDLLHGAGNFALALFLYKPLRQLLLRLKARYFKVQDKG